MIGLKVTYLSASFISVWGSEELFKYLGYLPLLASISLMFSTTFLSFFLFLFSSFLLSFSFSTIYQHLQGCPPPHCRITWLARVSTTQLYYSWNSIFDLNLRQQTSRELNPDLQDQTRLCQPLSYTPLTFIIFLTNLWNLTLDITNPFFVPLFVLEKEHPFIKLTWFY